LLDRSLACFTALLVLHMHCCMRHSADCIQPNAHA
jgi:hypothetical protein